MNPSHVKQLARLDPVMAEVIGRVGAITLDPRRRPPFHALVHAVIYQQISGKAADAILGRVQQAVGGGAFPTPGQILETSPDTLRAAGLSRPKAGYVRDIAEKSVAGLLPELATCDALTDTEIMARLTTIKGIGRWTVEMFLIFNLGRTDVLPVHDLGVRKGFQRAYRKRALPEPEALDRFGRRWAPHRSTAALYLWRIADGEAGGNW